MKINQISTGNLRDTFELTIRFSDLKISRREIELTLGYEENKMPKHFSVMVDEIINELPERCFIRAGYRILDVTRPADIIHGLFIGESFFNTDKIIAGQIKKSEKIAVFVATIGPVMEEWAKELYTSGDTVVCYLVDTIASVTAEKVAGYVLNYIESVVLKQGLKVTNRYSPGYCNWPLSEQHLLFSLLPPDFCGISLNESAFMDPVKSVSGIIGIGQHVKRKDYICDICGVQDCTYRPMKVLHAGL